MLRNLLIATAGLLMIESCSSGSAEETSYNYPKTRKVDTVDTYFGVQIADPYRWLEDDNSDSTKAWVDAQNALTFDYLSKIPFRDKIKDRLTTIWNFEKRSAPYRRGTRYFYSRNDGLQNQSVQYYMDTLGGSEKLLFDPNTLAADGTASFNGGSPSNDGKYYQYSISKAGSDWSEFYVKDIATGEQLADHIEWIKFSGAAWKGSGFFYGRFDEPTGSALSAENKNQKVYYHKIGDDQSKDELIYKDDAHPDWMFGPDVTDDEKWLILYTSKSTHGGGLMVKDLTKPNSELITIVPLADEADEYGVLDIIDGKLIMRTDHGAPNFKLVEVDLNNPAEANWKTIIPEATNYMLGISMVPNAYIVHYLVDVKSKLEIFDRTGVKKGDLQCGNTEICSVNELSTHKKDSLVFVGIGTFTAPQTIYKYNLNTGTSEMYFQPKCDFKSDDYETKQVFFTSKDGTKVPMFITHKKGITMDGNNPAFLFGYGGFNSHYSPEFRIDRCVFLESGGVYAVANIRGGDEYGEKWHQGGILCNKQNVFDDFIAASEFLISEKYTNKDKLAVTGRSNGGLLIGAVETQRPDLFQVCIPQVGVLDMLRYHRFTIGRAWASDYGLSENEEQFKCLRAYSPLHNVKEVEYPATLITTGDHDDRVVPAHSFKFAATMQEMQKGKEPIMIRIDKNAGHGAGKPTTKQIEEWADIWSFVFYNLGMTY
jgi:prolyl oligopeptidase